MKRFILASLVVLFSSSCVVAADVPDVPAASQEFRTKYISENVPTCVKAIEDSPTLKTAYSKKTVEVYCTCRQRYSADVIAQAMKDGKRGKAVSDQAEEYADEKCRRVLLKNLEIE